MAALLHFLCFACCTGATLVVLLSLRARMDVLAERILFRLFAVASLILAILAEVGARYVSGLV